MNKMLNQAVKLISVDDHVIEHPKVWTDRIATKHHDRCPHVIELENGRQAWKYEDQEIIIPSSICRTLPEYPKPMPFDQARFDEMRPGAYDPVARLADMDEDGVWAQICFPTVPRFAGHLFLTGQDKTLALDCVRAYNDFILDEWCAAAPDRYIPLVVVPLWDVQLAVAELERTVAKGAKALAFSENPTVLGLPSVHTDHWDPLWKAVEQADIPICMHIGSSSKLITSSPEAPNAVHLTLIGANSMVAMADWFFCGALDRFPNLRIVLSEGGAGWVPYTIERAEHAWSLRGGRLWGQRLAAAGVERSPIEIFRQNMNVCIVKDDVAMNLLDMIGVERMMWESDYPHDDSLWPDSRRTFEETCKGLDDAAAEAIGAGNARRVFRLS